jgi:hypothetical protein
MNLSIVLSHTFDISLLKPQKIGVGGSIPRQLFPEERSVEEK